MNSNSILLCLGLVVAGISCESKTTQQGDSLVKTSDPKALYDLNSPSEKYFLPYVLEEISELTFIGSKIVLAVDDEKGKVFEYDLNLQEITNTISFHKAADFEGVELVNEKVYALKSNGDIFEFDYSKSDSAEPTKYETKLDISNDTEGLGYDPVKNVLLVACKGKGEISKKEVKGRAIYGFDLETKKLSEAPLFTISEKRIKNFLKNNEKRVVSNLDFKPSAIAFHPLQKTYYILSSRGKLLVVIDKNNEILDVLSLSPKVLHQPEGICFSPYGDMYISSEGDGGRGYIVEYKMLRK